MRYKHMVVMALLILFGVTAIVLLAGAAWRRARALTQRIADVQEEMARDPRPPYAALAEMMQERDPRDRRK